MTGVRIRVVTEPKEFESLARVWDDLLQKSDDVSIDLTYVWLSMRWRHFGGGDRLNILVIEKGQQVIGIVPLKVTEYRIGLFKLRALETMGSVNYNCVGLIHVDNRDEVVAAVLTYLEKEITKSRLVLRLSLVPEDSVFLTVLRERASLLSENLVIQETAKYIAPYIPLPATWDEYFSSLSQRRRQKLRWNLRGLEKEHSVKFQLCTADNIEDRLTEFFALHQRRWQSVNVKGVFYASEAKQFYRDIATLLLEKGWLHFSYLDVDGEMVSALFGYIYNGKFYAGTAGRDQRYSEYSVGHLHYMFVIRDAIERGLQEFDLLRGNEPYKFYWTKSTRRYMQVIAIRRGICPGLRLKCVRTFWRLHELRQYRLREIYSLYFMKRREKRELKRMGLKTSV